MTGDERLLLSPWNHGRDPQGRVCFECLEAALLSSSSGSFCCSETATGSHPIPTLTPRVPHWHWKSCHLFYTERGDAGRCKEMWRERRREAVSGKEPTGKYLRAWVLDPVSSRQSDICSRAPPHQGMTMPSPTQPPQRPRGEAGTHGLRIRLLAACSQREEEAPGAVVCPDVGQ